MKIVETKDKIVITDLTVEIQGTPNITLSGNEGETMFLEFNFNGRNSVDALIGSVNSLYKKKGVLKAKITLFKSTESQRQVAFNYQFLTPAVGMIRGLQKEKYMVLGVSLCKSGNKDSNVLSIFKQLNY